MMKSSLMRINLIFILLVLFIPNLASAETKTFIREYTYQASEMDSKLSCRAIALEQVKRLLLEELGTYLESKTEVRNFQLAKDKIVVLTAGIVRAEIIKEQWDGNSLKFWMKAKITADSDDVTKALDFLRRDSQKTKDLEEAMNKAEALTREIDKMKQKVILLKTSKHTDETPQSTRQAQENLEKYNKTINELIATDWFKKGYSYLTSGDSKKAIYCFDRAIEFNPNYAEAYFQRAFAYQMPEDIKKAIRDCYKAIEIDPKYGNPYGLLHMIYGLWGSYDDYKQSIKDSSRVIALYPNNAKAHLLRGMSYYMLGDNKKAISDIKFAAELGDPIAQHWLESHNVNW